ncbi:MAG: 2-C-methyl-D-erythritol 4-phosphate cytidylyltransferase, partial [Alistipes sp.]|nr:2-C-methyl-D-erythritol 4-phosphate cytidylyltransferase [Alistipes sp.]
MAARTGVIIVAGGSGRRMSSQIPKQFLMLGNMPVLARTINTFSEAFPSADMVVVLPEAHIAMWRDLAARFDVAAHRCVAGGAERIDSDKSGLAPESPLLELISVNEV